MSPPEVEDIVAANLRAYSKYDNALRRQLFNARHAGQLVYLDMDDEVLEAAGAAVAMTGASFQSGLLDCVSTVLMSRDRGLRPFAAFDRAIQAWSRSFIRAAGEGDVLPPPPVVGLLATFTLAAERMGDGRDSHIHDNAYYPRLAQMLRVADPDRPRFVASFRESSEAYWAALRAWLEREDGRYGLPSAYSLSHRYVGLPISQALIRDKERQQLLRMFSDMSLDVGVNLSREDMEETLDQWIHQMPSPASRALQGLWDRSGARERIADIALASFEAWEGTTELSERRARGHIAEGSRVTLTLAQASSVLRGRMWRLGLLLPSTLSNGASFRSADGEMPFATAPLGPGIVGAAFSEIGVDASSALTGVIEVFNPGGQAKRFPRPIIPFLRDSFTSVYRELARLVVGEDCALLVQEDKGVLPQVLSTLAKCARPGFDMLPVGAPGIPTGWRLITSIQLLTIPRATSADSPGALFTPACLSVC